jgi:pimeloyl-ACP methyl ester carboxylesterase
VACFVQKYSDVRRSEWSSQLSTVNETTVAWYELGSGPPLVLLHGLADSHRTWRFVAPALARHFHVYMIDLPGHGLSARPNAPYTLPWYADTVSSWMDAIGLDRAHVCGHSYGGGIAQWMLLEHRDRIDRLALLASGGLGREVGTILRLAALPLFAPLLESRLFGPIARFSMEWMYHSKVRRVDIASLARWCNAPNSGMAFRRTVAACIGLNGQSMQTWHHIHRIESLPPLALFWGGRDTIIPIHHGRETIRRIQHATIVEYPDCGHCPHIERPHRFSEDLMAFLENAEHRPALLADGGTRGDATTFGLPAIARKRPPIPREVEPSTMR